MTFVYKDPLNFMKLSPVVRYLKGHRGFIAGGAFKYLLLDEKPKDLDVYFQNEADFKQAVAFFSERENFDSSYMNDKVVAFVDKETNLRIELIRSIYGKPSEIISLFDFTLTKFALYYDNLFNEENGETDSELNPEDFNSYSIVLHELFFEDLMMKRLQIDDQILYPTSTWERSYKYRDYGYKLCRESELKLLDALKLEGESEVSRSFYNGFD